MARVKDSLSSHVELGARLRQLRVDAGLSVTEMVRRMNHNRGFVSRIGRLEEGRLKLPSLALVCDYLRVLGKSISELAPVLDQYTSKRVPLEKREGPQTTWAPIALARSRMLCNPRPPSMPGRRGVKSKPRPLSSTASTS